MRLTPEAVKVWREEAALKKRREREKGIKNAQLFVEVHSNISLWVKNYILNDNLETLMALDMDRKIMEEIFQGREFFKLFSPLFAILRHSHM